MDDDELHLQLARLGKGVVQANVKLARVIERLAAPPVEAPEVKDALFDLIDATERAASSAPHGVAEGLRLAVASAVERLASAGITSVELSGAVDPTRHAVVGTRPASEDDHHGTIAETHARGWTTAGGAVRRYAQVTAFQRSDP